jgi:cyclopropane fatty-acyl-phospholipid synthase-like methyltransferase
MTDRTNSVMTRVGKRARWTGRQLSHTLRRKLMLSRLTARSSTRRAALVGPPDQWAAQRRFQFEFLTSNGLQPEHRLLDIGCGTLRGGIPLIEYLHAGNYTGVEVRATVLEEARKELAESGLDHKDPLLIHAEDPAEIQSGEPFDIVWAFMVLIHMPDEVVDGYLRLVSQRLTEGGEFYANVALGDRADGRWQGFPVVFRPREFYRGTAAAHGLRMNEVGALGSLGPGITSHGRHTMMLRFSHASE